VYVEVFGTNAQLVYFLVTAKVHVESVNYCDLEVFDCLEHGCSMANVGLAELEREEEVGVHVVALVILRIKYGTLVCLYQICSLLTALSLTIRSLMTTNKCIRVILFLLSE